MTSVRLGNAAANPPDKELLRAFAATSSEAAFALMVARHADLVYSVAQRQTNNDSWSRQATEAVFLMVARQAAKLHVGKSLPVWFFRTTLQAARDAQGFAEDAVHQAPQVQCSNSEFLPDASEEAYRRLAPHLNEAMASLRDAELHAVILRCLQRRTFGETGHAFGWTEQTTRARVSRALDQLRASLARQRLMVSPEVLMDALRCHALPPAPTGLADSILHAVEGHYSAPAARVAQLGIRRQWWSVWRRWMVLGGASLMLSLALILQARWERQTLERELHEAVIAVDSAISAEGNPAGLLTRLHFRNAGDRVFAPVLADYVRAASAFRRQLGTDSSGQPTAQMAYEIMLNDLFNGVNPSEPVSTDSKHALTQLGPRPISLVKDGQVWKWDYFNLTPSEAREERMRWLSDRTKTFDKLTTDLRDGRLPSPEAALQKLRSGVM